MLLFSNTFHMPVTVVGALYTLVIVVNINLTATMQEKYLPHPAEEETKALAAKGAAQGLIFKS